MHARGIGRPAPGMSPAQVQGTLHIVIYRPNQIATPVYKVGPPNQPSNNVNGGLTTIPQNQGSLHLSRTRLAFSRFFIGMVPSILRK
ncbi:Os11g0609550 [Oryza sativa Japonica Group]|uniref:Os11g0609550 protein n=1 Tax=Oryza sativa subsp. japonica TaxID=39947 RepID=A0A0P0Y4I3_ORYSJ|nr:Os11g0609550 [Oryza sativa Japonica Group]